MTYSQSIAHINQHLDFYRALSVDPRVPRRSRLLIRFAVWYWVAPFDLIPDSVPVIGQVDDLVLMSMLMFIAMWWVPGEVYKEHNERLFPHT